MSIFKGSGVAIITPFNENGVNYDKLGELLEWHIKNNTDAIIICGTTGEAATMTDEEKKGAIKYTVDKVAKRIPVIAGTGSNDTKHSVELSQFAQNIGADAVLCITPYYNKTTQKGLVAHFSTIARNINIPIIIYNVPSRTGMNITPLTLKELSKYKNIAAIKEASGDISQIAEIARLCKDIDIYSGNDDQVVPILSLGGIGVISVTANIMPKKVHEMVYSYISGDTTEALNIQLDLNPLNKVLFIETNPIPVKTAMNMMGMDVGPLRLPLVDMDVSHGEILKNTLKTYGLL